MLRNYIIKYVSMSGFSVCGWGVWAKRKELGSDRVNASSNVGEIVGPFEASPRGHTSDESSNWLVLVEVG